MIVIIDIGKTNKKCLVFDENYRVVYELVAELPEISDEDGFPCEDIEALTRWVREVLLEVIVVQKWPIRTFNCTAYGASLLCLNAAHEPVFPLYNYLKPYPPALLQQFYQQYGNPQEIATQTASPVLAQLNAGLQLYRLKLEQPDLFQTVRYAVHLPQYIAYLVSGVLNNEMTSLGCHTMLWDFKRKNYANWVEQEGFAAIMPEICPSSACFEVDISARALWDKAQYPGYLGVIGVGVGLHDSSAALIPYLLSCKEPFVLISTGTWSISLNPFNTAPLTLAELEQDCLCYLSYEGNPVKASRLFLGRMHDERVGALAESFQVDPMFFKTAMRNSVFEHDRERQAWAGYQALVKDLAVQQKKATELVIGENRPRLIFVDGGFAKNELFISYLEALFPEQQIMVSDVAQATALGAALVLHDYWNKWKKIPTFAAKFE